MNVQSAMLRIGSYAAVWLVLTEGATTGWLLPLIVITSAAVASTLLAPRGTLRWHATGVVRFVPFFLFHSFTAGVDVARRALHPGVPVAPAMLEFIVRLPDGSARRFFAAIVSLFPGTLTARMHRDRLTLHLLDEGLPLERTLRMLEERTADLFGVTLPTAP